MLKVGVIGATGYTGLELVRLLLQHPEVQLTTLTSERQAGVPYGRAFPQFQDRVSLTLEKFDPAALAGKIDFAFLCLPHHEAMDGARALLDQGIPVVDLSADFRLRDVDTYQQWYGPHSQAALLKEAVYGLPELYREEIKQARLVANPGCYPTSCILGLAPLIQKGLIDIKSIHCDSKSGVSGAGRSLNQDLLFCETNESLKAYKIGKHRHTPEIEQELSQMADEAVKITFIPHLIPMDRGILSTLYAKNTAGLDSKGLHELYAAHYEKEPFVRLKELDAFPSTRDVYRSNYCDIGVYADERTERIIVVSAIDNLTKGASGQAVQNMNLIQGFPETTGLI